MKKSASMAQTHIVVLGSQVGPQSTHVRLFLGEGDRGGLGSRSIPAPRERAARALQHVGVSRVHTAAHDPQHNFHVARRA